MASASTWFNFIGESLETNMFARREQSLWLDQQGSALIEGAAVIPLLIALVFGVLEFSWLFYQQHLVAIGLHDAADYLARSPDPCNAVSPRWKAEQQHAKNLATHGSLSGGAARVRGWTPQMVTTKCSRIDNPVARNGLNRFRGASVYVVTAATEFSYPSLGFLNLLHLRSPGISASYSERAIGAR
jgi:Flp pilus assembly protein TadG